MINPGLYKLIEQYKLARPFFLSAVSEFSSVLCLYGCCFNPIQLPLHLPPTTDVTPSCRFCIISLFDGIVMYPVTKSQFFGYDRFYKKESPCYSVGLVTCIITEFLLIFFFGTYVLFSYVNSGRCVLFVLTRENCNCAAALTARLTLTR